MVRCVVPHAFGWHAVEVKKPTKSKYRNVATWVDGYRFDSKREAKCYVWCKDLVKSGEIRYFLRQVPIYLAPAGEHKKQPVLMRVDFLLFYKAAYPRDGAIPQYCWGHANQERWIDAKGIPTRDWVNKAAMAESLYGIKIETW